MNMLGKANRMNRFLTNGYTLSRGDIKTVFKTMLRWGWLELTEGWHTWGSQAEENIAPKQSASGGNYAETTASPTR